MEHAEHVKTDALNQKQPVIFPPRFCCSRQAGCCALRHQLFILVLSHLKNCLTNCFIRFAVPC